MCYKAGLETWPQMDKKFVTTAFTRDTRMRVRDFIIKDAAQHGIEMSRSNFTVRLAGQCYACRTKNQSLDFCTLNCVSDVSHRSNPNTVYNLAWGVHSNID